MKLHTMFIAALAMASAGTAGATEARLRTMHATTVATPDQSHAEPIPVPESRQRELPFRARAEANPETDATGEPTKLRVYPVAGTIALDGGDLSIPYYVDLDPSGVRRDFNCTDLTFNGHSGHDPYIRSFREQAIGVPVFAALDGTVIDVHDGEPDENVDNKPRQANFITLRHANDMVTQYVHLRRNSIPFRVGDFVTAGTQIGLVGSSGTSTAPHAHFEVQYQGESFEPMAGPCRAGRSYFEDPQPAISQEFALVGATFSSSSFEHHRPAPFDDAPHTGTFARGNQTIYFKADVANVGATTEYELHLRRPNSIDTIPIANGRLVSYESSLASVWWAIDVSLDVNGEWAIVLDVDGKHTYTRPFRVVSTMVEATNRAPNPISVSLQPLRTGDVPVCRVSGNSLADPDYDIVSYRYTWQVNGTTVRELTSAARTDALARNLVRGGDRVSCSVTASDGVSSTVAAPAFSDVRGTRRRSVGSR